MNKVKPTSKSRKAAKARPRYNSALRQAQAEQTRERIARAAASLLDAAGGTGAITFRAVAEAAGVTEMTVYRYFPTREALLRGLWSALNREMAPGIGLPSSRAELIGQHPDLFGGFDAQAPRIIASVTTPQGREMRNTLNKERRKAFTAIVNECAPDLPPAEKKRRAAILQLLHSAHAWLSLREQWDLDGSEAGKATRWAIETLITNLRTPG